MKYTVALFLALVAFCYAAEDDGSYHPSDEGEYVPEGSGRPASPQSRRLGAPLPYRNQPSYEPSGEGPEARARILRNEQEVDVDGYRYLYETENGIFGEEEGHLQNQGTENEAMRAIGDFKYTAPDGVVYAVSYVADENGFQPAGAHLPTPPPVPEVIARSIAQLAAAGKL